MSADRAAGSAGPASIVGEPLRHPHPLVLVLSTAFAAVGAMTFANAPYTLAGYGLGMFALLTLGLLLPRLTAFVCFTVGYGVGTGVALDLQTSFAQAQIGAAVILPLLLLVFLFVRPKAGYLGSALLVVTLETLAAVVVGLSTFGSSGSYTAMAIMDVVYVLPAAAVARMATSDRPLGVRIGGSVLGVAGTVLAFLSGSVFLAVGPLLVGVLMVLLTSVLAFSRPRILSSWVSPARRALALTLVMLLLASAVTATSSQALGYDLRAALPESSAAYWTHTAWVQPSSASPGCRPGWNFAGDGTFAGGVWHKERLHLIDPCRVVQGTVAGVSNDSGYGADGDFSFDLHLPSSEQSYLTIGDGVLNGGTLHVEVVPRDQPSVLRNLTLCLGMQVQVTGAFVIDTDHGMGSEIHPAWSVVVLDPTCHAASPSSATPSDSSGTRPWGVSSSVGTAALGLGSFLALLRRVA
ncbi:MAG: hypothetical protein KGJ69_13830 [Thermoplasmata archaeon]|nr:hypothetical protein [Thermoplasmata archaeon]